MTGIPLSGSAAVKRIVVIPSCAVNIFLIILSNKDCFHSLVPEVCLVGQGVAPIILDALLNRRIFCCLNKNLVNGRHYMDECVQTVAHLFLYGEACSPGSYIAQKDTKHTH